MFKAYVCSALVASMLLASCGQPYCAADQTETCPCPGPVTGVKTCDVSADAFGPCVCPVDTGGGTSTGGSGGATKAGGSGGGTWSPCFDGVPPEKPYVDGGAGLTCDACMKSSCPAALAECECTPGDPSECCLAKKCLEKNGNASCPGPNCAFACDGANGAAGKLLALESCREHYCQAACTTTDSCGMATYFGILAAIEHNDPCMGERIVRFCCAEGIACGEDVACIKASFCAYAESGACTTCVAPGNCPSDADACGMEAALANCARQLGSDAGVCSL